MMSLFSDQPSDVRSLFGASRPLVALAGTRSRDTELD